MNSAALSPPLSGLWIVFEGIDGCGKSTQLRRLSHWLQSDAGGDLPGHPGPDGILQSREPGATELGKSLRSLLLTSEWQTAPPVPTAELLLYAADRAQHLQQVVVPHLAKGGWVLCDRHIDSTVAYQGYGRGLDLATIDQLNHLATGGRESHLTLWIDTPVVIAQTRLQQRLAQQQQTQDRMEANALNFHHRVRQGFVEQAQRNPHRMVRIAGDQDEAAIAGEIQTILRNRLAPTSNPEG